MARSVAFALAATCYLLRWCRERQVRGFRRTYHGWPSNGRKCRSMAADPRERMSVGHWKQPLLSRWPEGRQGVVYGSSSWYEFDQNRLFEPNIVTALPRRKRVSSPIPRPGPGSVPRLRAPFACPPKLAAAI
jgi:hypothetical protein